MDGLYLVIRSFAQMDIERAKAVARAFDTHPRLRPVKVGGDPARIKVEPSMESLVGARDLPIEWLTVRRNGHYPDFEGGEIRLYEGRGGWSGSQPDMADPAEIGGPNHIDNWVYDLTGHTIEQHWRAETLAEPGSVNEVAALFEDLVLAIDAAYGYVVADSVRPRRLSSLIDRELPGVFWLNYFGPAFQTTHPDLKRTYGSRTLSSNGVIIQTTDLPWQPTRSGSPDSRSEVSSLFDAAAFTFTNRNPSLPSVEAHVAASAGSQEMPWIAHLARKAVDKKAKKYTSARRRLLAALEGRIEPTLAPSASEWSTSFDTDDFLAFFAHLKRRLAGELMKPVGTALRAVIANAPLDEEDDLVLDTKHGPIRIAWFIDDTDTIDLAVCGAPEVLVACDAWLS